MVTIRELLIEATKDLEDLGIRTARLDAEILLYNILGVERIYLHVYPEKEVGQDHEKLFLDQIEKRKKHMPIQYIINNQEFMALDFWVEEGVLIPRPDTESLVEKVIEIYKDHYSPENVNILEIGTGSGAIIVSLAKYIENAKLDGIDISAKAISISKKNAKANKVDHKIEFSKGSLFDPLLNKGKEKTYDFIVSNPPYIAKDVMDTLDSGVKDYEPHLALEGGEDGLDFYKDISREAGKYLKDSGYLVFEIGYDQGQAISKLLQENNFEKIDIVKDLAGLDRVVWGKLKSNHIKNKD